MCGNECALLISHFQLSLLMSQTGLSHFYIRNLTTAISIILLFLILLGPTCEDSLKELFFPKECFFPGQVVKLDLC